jgi:hypothetical protein
VKTLRMGLMASAVSAATIALALVSAGPAAVARTSSTSGCLGHRPGGDIYYSAGCTGHDEPELDPVSGRPGSARDLTWNVVLPSDDVYKVSDLGVFWFGGTVDDPSSAYGQAFEELQFYPDSIVTSCPSNGGFHLNFSKDTYTACSPVWRVHDGIEDAAFNAMLTDGQPGSPLIMHAGDTVRIHYFVTPARDGWHIEVTDVTTGGSGTIVLDSATDGPLNPAYSRQKIGNSLKWGLVHDTPASFVWEIGHTSTYAHPPGQFCVPGQTICDSYDASWWAGTLPIQITSVRFGDGTSPRQWAVVSDYGGTDEVSHFCGVYGAPFCTYPWYAWNGSAFSYGVDFPGTVQDWGQAGQFATSMDCGGQFGPKTTYCDTILTPSP